MKEGLQIGTEAVVQDIVSYDMRPAFDGRVVHDVYGTVAMVYHMEWAARRVILPFLEDHEEGIGMGLEVRHLQPAPIGAMIRAKAVCTAIDGNVVVCDVTVWYGERQLGAGQVRQRILERQVLHKRFLEMWAEETRIRD